MWKANVINNNGCVGIMTEIEKWLKLSWWNNEVYNNEGVKIL